MEYTHNINGYKISTSHKRIDSYFEQLFFEKKHSKLACLNHILTDHNDKLETNYIDNFSLTLNQNLICKN